jgi:asparaginyl-tRNA synthetase
MQTPRTRIADALRLQPPHAGIRVKGWIRTIRSSKSVLFLSLNDGSTIDSLQAVVGSQTPLFEQLRHLTTGAALELVGELVASPAKGQAVELVVSDAIIVGPSAGDYPLQKKHHGYEFLREIAHLRVRTNTFGAVFRIRSALAQAIHAFFRERHFHYVHTPIITASDCEGAGAMFKVTTLDVAGPPRLADGSVDWSQDFFARAAYLTVSGQLAGEAFAMGLSEIYTFGPTFRAENSNTPRHVAEFWMIEPEVAWADLDDDCRLAEDFIKALLRDVLDSCHRDLEFLDERVDNGLVGRLEHVVSAEFERLSYAKAVELLCASNKSFEYPVHFGAALQTEHERYLTEELVGRPIFVCDYPREITAFYMRRNDDGRTVAAMDLLVPKIGELIGGSQREERVDVLERSIVEHGLRMEDYAWYLDTRRYGSVPHAGFGLGFERLVMYATGMSNIRDVTPFPRTPRNCDF